MEILIGLLVVGLLAAVGLSFKFLGEDTKESTRVEDAKTKRIADLEAEVGRKDQELKKALGEIQRIEDAYYQAKNDLDVAKKEASELEARLKQAEKAEEEQGASKQELKDKETALHHETTARQKLQGEIALADREVEKAAERVNAIEKKLADVQAELKTKTEMYDGLKGQFEELEAQLQKPAPKEPPKPESPKSEPGKPEPLKQELPKPEPPKQESPKQEPPKPEPPKPEPPKQELPKPEPPKPEPPKQELPKPELKPVPLMDLTPKPPDASKGGPGVGFMKSDLKQGVPSDTDFLKAGPAPTEPGGLAPELPEGTFKITNVNKPVPPASSPAQDEPDKKDKTKSKRETLIPGFQPKERHLPDELQ